MFQADSASRHQRAAHMRLRDSRGGRSPSWQGLTRQDGAASVLAAVAVLQSCRVVASFGCRVTDKLWTTPNSRQPLQSRLRPFTCFTLIPAFFFCHRLISYLGSSTRFWLHDPSCSSSNCPGSLTFTNDPGLVRVMYWHM